jgi:hypothetical protein
MPDMQVGKRDIGMGGTLVTLERQEKPASATRPTPTAGSRWCADVSKL